MTQAAAYLGDKSEPGFLILAVVAVISAVGVLLLIGFLTRLVALVAAMAGVSSVLFSFPGVNSGPLLVPMTAVLFAVIAVAVACLGPGAFSLDARLFGRREIIIPTIPSQK